MRFIRSTTVLAVIVLVFGCALPGAAWQLGGGARKQGNPPDGKEASGLYIGTLGPQQVVLEIRQGGAAFAGRYFYSRIGKAIPLKGTRLPSGEFRAREMPGGKANGAEWLLATSGNDASGYFCKCDVRAPAAPGAKAPLSITMARAAKGLTYKDLLLDFPLKLDPEVQVSNEVAWVMQTDTRFKASMPRLTRFPDKKIMEKVNADLDAKLKESRLHSAVQFQGDAPEEGEWNEEIKVGLVSRDVLSLRIVDFYSVPDTAYPDASVSTRIYDLHTGGEFDFEKFFIKSEELPKVKVEDPEDAAEAPGERLNNRLAALYLKHYGKPPEGCEDKEDEILNGAGNPHLYFEKEGLSVEYELAHAIRGCGEARIIPYRELEPLVRKDGRMHYLTDQQ
ncbi:MAG TPA: hypothetical protein VNW97_14475 [Candidatus Saccharimonadales bacterium]|jgi:hypothetical protein|nr:hypothetical protein [Candidatus Saccharimonadales bacterium]